MKPFGNPRTASSPSHAVCLNSIIRLPKQAAKLKEEREIGLILRPLADIDRIGARGRGQELDLPVGAGSVIPVENTGIVAQDLTAQFGRWQPLADEID